MKLVLQRIKPASLAASFAVIGFVLEIPFAVAAVVSGARGWGGTINGLLPIRGQGAQLIVLGLAWPVLCAFAGALLGAVIAFALNAASRMGGGIEIEVQTSSVLQSMEGRDRPPKSPNYAMQRTREQACRFWKAVSASR
jgi:hypothetical protein